MATAQGLTPRSVRKYHVILHSIFRRAVRDGLILTNPCEHTELPKIVLRRSRTLTPEEFDQLIQAIPERYRLMVETAIETGMRWGELIALRPRHIDFLRRQVTVEETIIEVSKRHSPMGERMIVKPYPKDNEAQTFGVRARSGWMPSHSTSPERVSAETSSCSRPKLVRRSRVTPFELVYGFRQSGPRVSISTSVCTTRATHTEVRLPKRLEGMNAQVARYGVRAMPRRKGLDIKQRMRRGGAVGRL
jgi:hypothetical protein